MKLSEAIEAIEDASGGEYLKRIDAVEYTDWQDVAFTLYAEYAALKRAARAILHIPVDSGDSEEAMAHLALLTKGEQG